MKEIKSPLIISLLFLLDGLVFLCNIAYISPLPESCPISPPNSRLIHSHIKPSSLSHDPLLCGSPKCCVKIPNLTNRVLNIERTTNDCCMSTLRSILLNYKMRYLFLLLTLENTRVFVFASNQTPNVVSFVLEDDAETQLHTSEESVNTSAVRSFFHSYGSEVVMWKSRV